MVAVNLTGEQLKHRRCNRLNPLQFRFQMWVYHSSTARKAAFNINPKTSAEFVLFLASKSSDNLDAGITWNFSRWASLQARLIADNCYKLLQKKALSLTSTFSHSDEISKAEIKRKEIRDRRGTREIEKHDAFCLTVCATTKHQAKKPLLSLYQPGMPLPRICF